MDPSLLRPMMLILNGKSAGDEPLRDAVHAILDAGVPLPGYQPVRIRQVALDLDLTNASKLDRSPAFIDTLFQRGESAAQSFLNPPKTES